MGRPGHWAESSRPRALNRSEAIGLSGATRTTTAQKATPKLPALELRHYEKAILIRCTEQRLLDLFSEGKLFGTVHTCIGQEFTGVAIAESLQQGDKIVSNHRCHGHFLAWTDNVEGLLAEIMGRASGVCGGRGGSQHLCSDGFYSNGVQGGITPMSAGLAMAEKIRKTGNIVVVCIGDGTLGEGVLYETMNIVSKWELPVLILLENNLYAQSTSQRQTLAGGICARAEAFDIRTWRSSTWNPEELLRVAGECVAHVRAESRPAFLQIDTYRLMAHSKGDDDRDPAEIQEYWARDPLKIFADRHPAEAAHAEDTARARIDAAVERAEQADWAGRSESDGPFPADAAGSSHVTWCRTDLPEKERVVARIRSALQANMKRDHRILLIGEDMEDPYGGAFKVTRGLSEEFPDRVRNTPISEAAIIGVGCGLAMNDQVPVCELMFGDFMALAADQIINHAAKYHYMYNEQVTLPLIIRTPMGGKRGYGPTHSQSLEKHFMGIPQTVMLAIHHRYDPKAVYDELFRNIACPTMVIENKLLYAVVIDDEVPGGFSLEHSDEAFPTTRIRPQCAPDVTVLCYGGTLLDVERAVQCAFEEHEIIAEVVCPIQLYPFNPWPVIESLRQSGRLLVVEEGQSFAAFGSEVIAQISELAPGVLGAVKRLGPPAHPIPASGPFEKEVLPNPQNILSMLREVADIG